MTSCCSFYVRSSAPVAVLAASSASTVLLVGHPADIGLAGQVVASLVSFFRVEFVLLLSALTVLTLWLLPSHDLTGSSTRGEADSMLWGGRSFHVSWRGADS